MLPAVVFCGALVLAGPIASEYERVLVGGFVLALPVGLYWGYREDEGRALAKLRERPVHGLQDEWPIAVMFAAKVGMAMLCAAALAVASYEIGGLVS